MNERFIERWITAWDQFWFTDRDITMLSLIRILTGALVFYTHAVWTFDFQTFLGGEVLPTGYRELAFNSRWAWSHFDWLGGSTASWTAHWIGLLTVASFTVGCCTRVTAVMTALLVISYANRATGALFGLDQINAFLCLYLAIGRCDKFSLDAWWRSKRTTEDGAGQGSPTSISTNVAIRLIQIHLCIVYLFAGLGKMQGTTWFSGEAVWFAMASYEYQTLDMTWLANWPGLVSALSLGTLFWEIGYAALIWPRLTRPIMLAIAVPVHLGIGICMGMIPFGLAMLVANLAFVEPPTRAAQSAHK